MKNVNRTRLFLRAVLLWCVTSASVGLGCTVFNITDQGRTLVGANEDWTTDRFQLWVRPPKGKDHGMIVWGVDDAEKYPFAGFNDKGLFFDLASAPPPQPPKQHPEKETHENPLYVRMLASCSTVAEAIEFMSQFNVAGLAQHHVMVVDRNGDSAVIEAGAAGQLVVRKQGRYQVMENFPLSVARDSPPSSGRYAIATRMLTEMPAPTFGSMRDVLRATRNNSPRYTTVFSCLVDLSTLQFRFYHNGNFDECFEADARMEFKKGEHRIRLAARFATAHLRATTKLELMVFRD